MRYELITAPAGAFGLVHRASQLAKAEGGPMRAPHHTVGGHGAMIELALAAGGVLFLEDPAEFSGPVLRALLTTAGHMHCPPRILLGVRGRNATSASGARLADVQDEGTTGAMLERLASLLEGHTCVAHHTATGLGAEGEVGLKRLG